MSADGHAYAHDSGDLNTAITRLTERIATAFKQKADYSKIAACKQKDDETPVDYRHRLEVVFRANSGITKTDDNDGPYQQQLKRAFIAGLTSKVKTYVERHWVHQNTGSVADAVDWATHAAAAQKKKQEQDAAVFSTDTIVVFSGADRGGYRRSGNFHRGRGRGRGRGEFTPSDIRDDRCYECERKGHYACERANRKHD